MPGGPLHHLINQMERRSFLKFLLSTPLATIVDYEQLLWVKEKTIFIPAPIQIETYDVVLEVPFILNGVPYHYSMASSGVWLGMERDAPVDYKRITLDEAIIGGHIRKHEIESIRKFISETNDA